MDKITVYKGCTFCKKSAEKMLKCGGCRAAYYCNRTCQKSDWSEHKRRCGTPNTIAALVKENVQKNPTSLLILSACARMYCSIRGGNAIQITIRDDRSFLLDANSVVTIAGHDNRIILGFKSGEAILVISTEPVDIDFLRVLESEAERVTHLEVFPNYQSNVYRIVCGLVTLNCDV